MLVYGADGGVGSNYVSAATIPNTSFFRSWVLVDNTKPLPVELISFSAHCNNDVVTVNWQTASETNNNYFTLESSIDGVTWVTVATVPGLVTAILCFHILTLLTIPLQGYHTSVLTQTDFNGQSKTFAPVTVNCSDANAENTGITLIYPNLPLIRFMLK